MSTNGVRDPTAPLSLRRSLGLPPWLVAPLVSPGTPFRKVLEVISWASAPIDLVFFVWLWKVLPTRVAHSGMHLGVACMVYIFKLLPKRFAWRGLSETLSIEAHALSTLMWGSRLLPINLHRIRLGLSSVSFAYPASPALCDELVDLPERGVRGYYLRTAPASVKDPPVLVWFFGGAFFGGSAKDQRGLMERYAGSIGCDAWLVDYRVCPEYLIEDAYRDGCRCYEWLLERKKPEQIVFFSCSSGGGVALRVLQLAAAPEAERRKYYLSRGPVPQPAGQVHIGPFVNYTVSEQVDPGNSLRRHQELDLIVNERIYEFVQPQLDTACGSRGLEGKRSMSPLFNEMTGLCPSFLSYGSHEVCVDDIRELAKKLRQAGCQVDVSEQPFLWHAYPLFADYMPEAAEEMQRMLEWIKKRNGSFSAAAAAASS